MKLYCNLRRLVNIGTPICTLVSQSPPKKESRLLLVFNNCGYVHTQGYTIKKIKSEPSILYYKYGAHILSFSHLITQIFLLNYNFTFLILLHLIMVAITYDIEIPSSIPAAKIFKAVVLDVDTLVPKIMPQAIKNVEILEGDGGVGTIKLIHFGEVSQYKSVKHRVDAIDKENLTHSYSIIEGDVLGGVIESVTYHVKIVPTEDGGSICKNRSIYNTKGDAEISEEKIKEGKEKAMAMFKAIEAYLLANPDA